MPKVLAPLRHRSQRDACARGLLHLVLVALWTGCAAPEPRLAPLAPDGVTRAVFPVLAHRAVDVRAVRLRLQTARGCKRSVVAAFADGMLLAHEAVRAGCRLRPFRGAFVLRAAGASASVPLRVDVPKDGRVVVRFTDIERALAPASLRTFDRLEFGEGGWAGRIDLARLREVWADEHAKAVASGRGAPGLFTALHPEHDAAASLRLEALHQRLRRQIRDYIAVANGRKSPSDFLLRHVWSPFRRSIEAALAGQPLPPVSIDPHAPREVESPGDS